MNRQMEQAADEIEAAMTTISGLADILIDNAGFDTDVETPQLGTVNRDTLYRAIRIISSGALERLCKVMNDLDAVGSPNTPAGGAQ